MTLLFKRMLVASALLVVLSTFPFFSAKGGDNFLRADIIMRADEKGISACGIGFKLASRKESYSLNLVVEKKSEITVTKIIATSFEQKRIVSATVRTRSLSTSDLLTKKQNAEYTIEYSKDLTPSKSANLFQQLMVTGGKIELNLGYKLLSWDVPGPASQSLRSMYLMCSGDMFRP